MCFRFAKIYQKLARVGMKSLQAKHLQNPIIELLSMFGADKRTLVSLLLRN